MKRVVVCSSRDIRSFTSPRATELRRGVGCYEAVAKTSAGERLLRLAPRILIGCLVLLSLVLAQAGDAAASYVTISSPANGATVRGTITISTTESSDVSWINVFVDKVWVASNSPTALPPYSVTWNSTRVADGKHTISVTGYSSGNAAIANAVIGMVVQNTYVKITSPASGATVRGTIAISTAESPDVSWINVFVDKVWVASNSPTALPPYSVTWNSTTVTDGSHTISATGYNSKNAVIATGATGIMVNNLSPTATPRSTATARPSATATARPTSSPTARPTATRTASPRPTATSSPKRTATPSPKPTSSAVVTVKPSPTPSPRPTTVSSGPVYYVDSNQSGYNGAGTPSGNCSNADAGVGTGTSLPWCTMARVRRALADAVPGSRYLFRTGSIWHEQLTLPPLHGAASSRILIGSYGESGRPVIDGAGRMQYCVDGEGTGASSPLFSYFTIEGFECRNTIYGGINFNIQRGGSGTSGQPGIVISHNLIHNTGPGAYAGGGGPYDDGRYRRQLVFWTQDAVPSGVKFVGNIVHDVGGHNSVAIEGDTGGPQEVGNEAYHCLHGCFDLKSVYNAMVDSNIGHDPLDGSESFYAENTGGYLSTCPEGNCGIPVMKITYQRNIAYGSQNVAFGCENLTSGAYTQCNYYNNTTNVAQTSIYKHCCGTCANGDVRIDARNNIFGGFQAMAESFSCGDQTTWDYNDDCALQGSGSCSVKINGIRYSSLAGLWSGGFGTHDLWEADPLFLNMSSANYTPAAGSPVLGAALLNLVGTAKDLGAIQVTP